MIPITPDANVVASGLLRGHTPPGQRWSRWLTEQVEFVLSEHLFDEIRHTVSQRTQAVLERDLKLLRERSRFVTLSAPVEGVAGHPEDDLILATVVSGGAHFLVTGDRGLLRLGSYEGVTIVTAREFLTMLPGFITDQLA